MDVENLEEGDLCPRCYSGLMVLAPVENCTCHCGHPPCSACVNNPLECNECHYRTEDDL